MNSLLVKSPMFHTLDSLGVIVLFLLRRVETIILLLM
jgi:hypothetical protein